MDPHMFDGLIGGLVLFGIVVGLCIAGAVWGIDHWVLPHIVIGWK